MLLIIRIRLAEMIQLLVILESLAVFSFDGPSALPLEIDLIRDEEEERRIRFTVLVC